MLIPQGEEYVNSKALGLLPHQIEFSKHDFIVIGMLPQGEEYVNSKTLADICFLVEGRPFYAHRIALLASSEAFRAMFNQVRGCCC